MPSAKPSHAIENRIFKSRDSKKKLNCNLTAINFHIHIPFFSQKYSTFAADINQFLTFMDDYPANSNNCKR